MTCRRLPDNPPACYGPGGSGFKILRALLALEGHAVGRAELQHMTGIRKRKGFGFTLEQMAIDRLVLHRASGFYEITPQGVFALGEMEAGRSYVGSHPTRSGGRQPRQDERWAEPAPTVRIFATARAA